jgi:hypothetical protein
MPHFVNGYICLLATGKRTRNFYVTARGKPTRLNSIEVSIGFCAISQGYCHAVGFGLAGFHELRIQTCTPIPGRNSFLHFRDPISWQILGLKGNDHFVRPIPFPWSLVIVRVLVL